jgi:Tol biopolymer transport system component
MRSPRGAVGLALILVVAVPSGTRAAARNGRIAFGTGDVYTYDGFDYERSAIQDATSTGRNSRVLWDTCNDTTQTICPGIAEPAYSHDGTRLAVVHDGKLATMGADGSDHRDLPVSAGYEAHPTWGPGDGELAYVDGADLYAVKSDGTNRRLLVRDAREPSWSSQNRIAYCSRNHPGIWILDLATNGLRRVTRRRDCTAAWSAAGRRLAFARDVFRHPAGQPEQYVRSDVYVTDAGARHARRLGTGGAPAWAPNGRALIVAGARDGYSYRIVDLEGHTRRSTVRTNQFGGYVGPATWQALPAP